MRATRVFQATCGRGASEPVRVMHENRNRIVAAGFMPAFKKNPEPCFVELERGHKARGYPFYASLGITRTGSSAPCQDQTGTFRNFARS